MTFENLIARGIRDTLEEKCAEYRVDGKMHRFSLTYKIRRRSILRQCRLNKSSLTIRKIRYILIAVILALISLTGFSTWRQLGGFSFHDFHNYSRVYYSCDNAKTKIEEIYGLPDEYELLEIKTYMNFVSSKYMVDGEIISLDQDLISGAVYVNTENKQIEYISVNGNEGYYINVFENEIFMSWVMDGYIFFLSGKLDKNTAMILAKSLEIKNF